MAKRGYKLQEFVAHAGNVNCLTFGKKNCRVFITGGDDQKVNLWSVGKPTSLMSLCGHTSPVESAAFDAAEVLVAAGSSSGAIKLWDLEETKMVRTLTGHRSYCTAVEFHPFGEFFASGSMDTNLKIWDIRKKGCIHTYKGHTRGISTIRFTPDGRWVVSGGFDNVVKVWDLTAGKLLHDFKFHEGHIRTIEFHPLEFLLATGSADKTVKFWDLETFEMIGSARRETAGVRSVTFHPDGRSLFCGLDDSLKVYSWEPLICHDSVDMGWSTLGDLCIHDGKLLGGAYYENSVAVWIADVSLMEPYGTRSAPEQLGHSELKHESQGSPLEKEESHVKSKSSLQSTELDSESKDIKTIYVDRVNSVSSKTADPVGVSKVVQPSDSGQISTKGIPKRNPRASSPPSDPKEISRNIIQKHGPTETSSPSDSSQTSTTGIQKQSPSPRASSPPSDFKEISSNRVPNHVHPESLTPSNSTKEISGIRIQKHGPPETLAPSNSTKEISGIRIQKHRPQETLPPSESKEISSVRIQKHRPQETLPPSEFKESSTTGIQKRGPAASVPARSNVQSLNRSIVMPNIVPRDGPGRDTAGSRRESIGSAKASGGMSSRPLHTRRLSTSRLDMERMSVSHESLPSDNVKKPIRKDVSIRNRLFPDSNAKDSSEGKQLITNTVVEKPDRTSLPATTSDRPLDSIKEANTVKVVRGVAVVHGRTRSLVERFERKETVETDEMCTPDRVPDAVSEPAETPPPLNKDQKIDVRVPPTLDDHSVLEDLMQSHDVLLSAFRSRLTKLQVVRHFWERNDVKGAINAVNKLPDHSVQADVIGVLIDRMEVITLDLFACLLPVLLGLLQSKAERHASVSLEMLLKLVAVFGTTVRTTVSAPRSVGVDLHAEERLECCRQCFTHLQNVQNIIPGLVKRGGVLARYAQQLNMVLQQT